MHSCSRLNYLGLFSTLVLNLLLFISCYLVNYPCAAVPMMCS
jgi:hypothetical protein